MTLQLFITLRADTDRGGDDIENLGRHTLRRFLQDGDWGWGPERWFSDTVDLAVWTVHPDTFPGAITVTTFRRHCTMLVDIPSTAHDETIASAFLDLEFGGGSDDVIVRAGRTHPDSGHMTSVLRVLFHDLDRRRWSRTDLGPTLEDDLP